MNNLIRLIAGDFSGDGHNRTFISTIKSNLTKEQIAKAYERGSDILGINFQEQCCDKYEECCITEQEALILKQHGIIDNEDVEEVQSFILDDFFCEIWLKIAKLGSPNFQYEFFDIDCIPIGGYGLFTE